MTELHRDPQEALHDSPKPEMDSKLGWRKRLSHILLGSDDQKSPIVEPPAGEPLIAPLTKNVVSRREFLASLGAAAVVAAVGAKDSPPGSQTQQESQLKTELGDKYQEIKAAYKVSDHLLHEIEDQYSIPGIYIPIPTEFARQLIENKDHLEDGVTVYGMKIELEDIDQIVHGPDAQTQKRISYPPNFKDRETPPPGLKKVVSELYTSLVKTDPGRIRTVALGDMHSFNHVGSVLTTQFGDPGYGLLSAPSFIHEVVHGTDPSANLLHLHPVVDVFQSTGSTLMEALRMDNKWYRFMLDHQDFIQAAIFDAPGDELSGFMHEGRVARVMQETIAMATTHLILGTSFIQDEKTAERFQGAIEELKQLTTDQLAFTVRGWNKEPSDTTNLVAETRVELGKGLATAVRESISEQNLGPFMQACSGNISRYRHRPGGAQNELIFYVDHELPNGTKIEWNWDTTAISDELVLLYTFSDLLRDQSQIFWPDGKITFND